MHALNIHIYYVNIYIHIYIGLAKKVCMGFSIHLMEKPE